MVCRHERAPGPRPLARYLPENMGIAQEICQPMLQRRMVGFTNRCVHRYPRSSKQKSGHGLCSHPLVHHTTVRGHDGHLDRCRGADRPRAPNRSHQVRRLRSRACHQTCLFEAGPAARKAGGGDSGSAPSAASRRRPLSPAGHQPAPAGQRLARPSQRHGRNSFCKRPATTPTGIGQRGRGANGSQPGDVGPSKGVTSTRLCGTITACAGPDIAGEKGGRFARGGCGPIR